MNGSTPQDSRQEVFDLGEDQEDLDDLQQPLHPLPKGLVEFYALLAVVLVLVPEWLANTALENLDITKGERLRVRSRQWQWDPELMLGAMTMAQLRRLARQQGLSGYSREPRDRLVRRLLRNFRRKAEARRMLQDNDPPLDPDL
ncbi:MAG: hypothetical protein OXF25_04065 [Cyanobacteria bacterium MAG CAR3_bin_5]|nr:hypothetical protein [Cyanobacteria bacterium MAG CAR4_bin_6]MCY4173233.1 hypothetical protein [Cyanobacteria bacterium MAG CAR3_bin_5]MCY4236376.1 hypothetical protein [Cyanobacteria bacterium MAG CAR2_bin_4]MCY4331141.1 hypothetical protein [Cyanobacteria bacterium MAG CAR1_bin_15]